MKSCNFLYYSAKIKNYLDLDSNHKINNRKINLNFAKYFNYK